MDAILDLQRIVRDCCTVFRGTGMIANADFAVFAPMPIVPQPFTQLVNCHYVIVSIDMVAVEAARDDVVRLLNRWPGNPWRHSPSFVDVGDEAGGQLPALCLFAIGHALGLWEVIVPLDLVEVADVFDGLSSSFVRVVGYVGARATA